MKRHTEFTSKKDFFSYLIANKRELIEFKKTAIKFTDAFGLPVSDGMVIKSLNTNNKDEVASGIIKRTIIGNTYNWMDSHDDVHLDNVFSKSISENQDKVWHLHDHQQMITAKVGKPTSIYEKSVEWKDLGVDKSGKTTALFMDSNIIKDYNPTVFDQYLSNDVNQHSVGMRYVNLKLAINDPELKDEYAVWTKHIDKIANSQKAIEQGFFWAVEEAKLLEISAVLAGSNELTPTLPNKETKKVCPNCGNNVYPNEDGSRPDCGEMMNEKSKESFYSKFVKAVQK